jgi:colanic acid/amylovoran biosynthesis glycosyltransferase
MRIAYVLYSYPALSQAFILREVQELRRRGIDVTPFSLRRAPSDHLLADADREEATRTVSLLPPDLPALLRAHAVLLAGHPAAYGRALARAVRDAGLDPRTLFEQLRYFAFAVLVWRQLVNRGVRHLHSHFSGAPTHVAWLVTEVGNAVERDTNPWTWSVTVHGPVEFTDVPTSRLSKRLPSALFIGAISSFARSQLMFHLEQCVWPKIQIVHCGLDPEAFPPRQPMPPDEPFRLLSVGRLVPAKGQAILIEALAMLITEGRAAQLTLAVELDVADHVRFAGAVGQDDMRSYYEWADAFCLGSLAEGVPVVLMEAMATGVPVVAPRVGGIDELIENGVTGLLVPPAQPEALARAVKRLIDDEDARARMIEPARRKVVDEFSIQQSVDALAALLPPAAS